MDRPKVLIKINGRERSFYETTTDKQEKESSNKPEGNVVEKKEDHRDQSEDIETLVDAQKLVEEEVAAGNEEREFDWILPERHPERESREEFPYDKLVKIDPKRKKSNPMIGSFTFPSKAKKSKNQHFPFKTLFLAIISALVIGTSFGMVVLHLFSEDLAQPAFDANQPVDSEGTNGATDPEAEPSNGEQVGSATPIALPALEVFVVQGGMFSSAEAAAPIVDGLKGEGFAGTLIHQDGKNFLFMGIGISDLASKAMATTYETAGKETYVKSFSIPAVNTEGDPAMVTAEKLFNQLVLYSSNKHTSMPESVAWNDIKTTYEELVAQNSETEFVKAVQNAYTSVEAYQGSSSNQDFWASQQALLTSLQSYQNWILEQNN
ncbi:hypothetical protein [Bacillus sp. AK128]